MLNDANKEEHSSLLKSSNGISDLLKSAAHPIRIRVLTLLLRGEGRFSELMKHSVLSKTALANHLDRLVKMSLVERFSRGKYGLTRDGKELLKAVKTAMKSEVTTVIDVPIAPEENVFPMVPPGGEIGKVG